MRFATIMLTLACCAPVLASSGPDLPPAGPWDDIWTMDLRGTERVFVVYEGTNWLWSRPDDFVQPTELKDQDLAVHAKFSRRSGERVQFYGLDKVIVTTADLGIAAAVDGDNFFVFGTMRVDSGQAALEVKAVESAPSDASIIASRLKQIGSEDWDGLLDFSDTLLAEAESKGNRAYWIDQAITIRLDAIERAAKKAGETKDPLLLHEAMGWALERAGSADLSAGLASAPWVLELDVQARAPLEEMLRSRGYVFYEDAEHRGWMTQETALTHEFEARYAQIDWRDAEAYYLLGLWAERYGDILPRATELSHRAFQKGIRANPNHIGLRRMLGLTLAGAGQTGTARGQALSSMGPVWENADLTARVTAPAGWNRSATPVISDGEATWVDGDSGTSYLAVIRPFQVIRGRDALWNEVLAQLGSLRSAAIEPSQTTSMGDIVVTRARFRFEVNDGPRQGEAALLVHQQFGNHILLRIVYTDDYAETAEKAFEDLIASAVMREPPPPPPPPGGAAAAPPAAQPPPAVQPGEDPIDTGEPGEDPVDTGEPVD